jgi:hypothetical protein
LYARRRAENKAEFLEVVQNLLDDFNDSVETDTLYEGKDEERSIIDEYSDDDGDIYYCFTTPDS